MSRLIKIAGWTGSPCASVVFVHGLTGDAYDTWRRGRSGDPLQDKTFWPLWLAEDVKGLSVYALSYEAPASGWFSTAMALEDRAANVRTLLLPELALGQHPLIFVCHSLGGLIIKQFILDLKARQERDDKARELLGRIAHVIFLATPHTGSRKATALDYLRYIAWPTPIARSLVANDPSLRKLNVDYRGLCGDIGPQLLNHVLYETVGTPIGTIVDASSADPGLIGDPLPVHADHVYIAKPDQRDSDVYRKVIGLATKYSKSPEDSSTLDIKSLPRITDEQPSYLLPKFVRLASLVALLSFFVLVLKPDLARLFIPATKASIVSFSLPSRESVYRDLGQVAPEQRKFFHSTQFEGPYPQLVYDQKLVDDFKTSQEAGRLATVISGIFNYALDTGVVPADRVEDYKKIAECTDKARLISIVRNMIPTQRYQYEEGSNLLIPFSQAHNDETRMLLKAIDLISRDDKISSFKFCGKTISRQSMDDYLDLFVPLLRNSFLPVIEITIENLSARDLSIDRISAVVLDRSEYRGGAEEFPVSPIISVAIGDKPGEYFARMQTPLRIGKDSRLRVRIRLEPTSLLSSYLMKLRFYIDRQKLETQTFAVDL